MVDDVYARRKERVSIPNVYSPYKASALKPVGRGFWLFRALGMEEPARMTEARRASSTPYDCLVWIR
jgi:hypothetical protein